MTEAAPRELGTFPVEAGRAEVDAFRRATGCDGADAVPLTFPMRWLTLPEIRRALMKLVVESDLVPVHESQTFDYAKPLETGVSYRLEISGHRASPPDRLIVDAVVLGSDDQVCARLETILRLVSMEAVA